MRSKLTRKKSIMEGRKFGHMLPEYTMRYLTRAAAPMNKDESGVVSVPQIFLTNKSRGSNRMKPKIRIRQKH